MKFKEYASFQTTTGDGTSLSLGYKQLLGGDTASYFDATKNLLGETATMLVPEESRNLVKFTKVAESLYTLKNTMTD